jgi:hypothetical protein
MATIQCSKRLMWWLIAAAFATSIISRPIEAKGISTTRRRFESLAAPSRIFMRGLKHRGAATTMRFHDTGMIPISMSLPGSSVQCGTTFSVSVTVDCVPSDGGNVQVGCDQPDLFTSPSGSWPYQLQYAGGAPTTASFSVQASSSADTSATFFACTADADPNDPSQWSVVGTVSIDLPPP